MKCIHCLKDIAKKDKDHLFPKSWYPDTTDEKVQYTTLPTCVECNREYGVIEERLLQKLSYTVKHDSPSSSGVVDGVNRSMDPKEGEAKGDGIARLDKRKKFIKSFVKLEDEHKEHTLPNIEGPFESEEYGLEIEKSDVEALCKKLAKGVLYEEEKILIDETQYDISTTAFKDGKEVFGIFSSQMQDFSKPPGLEIKYGINTQEGFQAIFLIKLWQQLCFFTSITVLK